MAACTAVAAASGLRVDDAVVLNDSNRLAVRLRPCDVLVRVAPRARQNGAEFEVEVARRLAETGTPLAALDPRVEPHVHEQDDFAVTLWTYYEPMPPHDVAPDEYADALERLHAGMRQADLTGEWLPHFMDRVEEAQLLVDDPTNNPEIAGADRELLGATLMTMRRAITDRARVRAAAARRTAPGQPAQNERRAAFRRPRDVLPWAHRVRHRPREHQHERAAVRGRRALCRRRPSAGPRVLDPHAGHGHRMALRAG